MSHFSVAIIHKDTNEDLEEYLEDILEPYSEHKVVEYTKSREEHIAEMRSSIAEYKISPMYKEYLEDPIAYKKKSANEGHWNYISVDFPKRLTWTDEECYQEAIAFYKDEEDAINEDGSTNETYNPLSKWDWWTIGGRWDNMLLLKSSGKKTNSAKVKDIDFEKMKENVIKARTETWNEFQDKIKAEPETEQSLRFMWGIEASETLESFTQEDIGFSTYAVLKDGEWLAKGEMGMWGIDSNVDEEWVNKKISIFANLNPEDVITVVDCHI
jgi:hypothetical protein